MDTFAGTPVIRQKEYIKNPKEKSTVQTLYKKIRKAMNIFTFSRVALR